MFGWLFTCNVCGNTQNILEVGSCGNAVLLNPHQSHHNAKVVLLLLLLLVVVVVEVVAAGVAQA
jgi:hypothetical protein